MWEKLCWGKYLGPVGRVVLRAGFPEEKHLWKQLKEEQHWSDEEAFVTTIQA